MSGAQQLLEGIGGQTPNFENILQSKNSSRHMSSDQEFEENQQLHFSN